MNRREFIASGVAAGVAAAVPFDTPAAAPALPGTVVDRGDWAFLCGRRALHARTWALWRTGIAFDDAYERALVEAGEDEAVVAFVVQSLRFTPWNFHALRLAQDEHLVPHVRFLPHARSALRRVYQDDLPAVLEALQTNLPAAVHERIQPGRHYSTAYVDNFLAAYWRIVRPPEPFRSWALRRPAPRNSPAWWTHNSVRSTFGLELHA